MLCITLIDWIMYWLNCSLGLKGLYSCSQFAHAALSARGVCLRVWWEEQVLLKRTCTVWMQESVCESYTVTDVFISNCYSCVLVHCWEMTRKQLSYVETFLALVALSLSLRDTCHMVPQILLHAISNLFWWNKSSNRIHLLCLFFCLQSTLCSL